MELPFFSSYNLSINFFITLVRSVSCSSACDDALSHFLSAASALPPCVRAVTCSSTFDVADVVTCSTFDGASSDLSAAASMPFCSARAVLV